VQLLLDEHINPAVARQLRRRGCDTVALLEVRMCGASDEQVLSYATSEKRAVVTYSITDFQLLLMEWHRQSRHHQGIVFIHEKSISQKHVGGLVKALQKLLKKHPYGLADQGLFLKARQLPEKSSPTGG
jgi:predicted nuclease of predicted toxin-antitoxin system